MVQQTKCVTYSYNHYDYEIPIKNGSKLKVTFLPKSAHHHHIININNGIMTDLHSSSTNSSGENSSAMFPYEDKGPKICHLANMMVMIMTRMVMMLLITVM